MGKLAKILLVFLLIFSVYFSPPKSLAADDSDQILPKGQVVNSDYFASGKNVFVRGMVRGDAYIIGGSVLIDGNIDRDLLVLGGDVTINGNVEGNVRVASGNLYVNGTIGKNLSAVSGNIYLNGNFGVGGNLVYVSPREAFIGDPSRIGGVVNHLSAPKDLNENQFKSQKDKISPAVRSARSVFNTAGFILAALIGFIFLKLFPARMLRLTEIIRTNPVKNWAKGLLTLLFFPIIIIAVFVTLIGIPLSIFLLVVFMFGIYLSKIWVGFTVGRYLFKRFAREERRGWALIAGLFVIYLLQLLPLGFLVSIVVVPLGLGGLVTEKMELFRTLKAKKIL